MSTTACTYSVAPGGDVTVYVGSSTIGGWASADGNQVLLGGTTTNHPYNSEILAGVKAK